MANSTVRRSANRNRRRERAKSRPLPMITRRFAAWMVEVSLIALSGLIPYSLGLAAKSEPTGEQVTLNPVVTVTTDAIATTLGLPASDSNNKLVTPLTNLFWSAAIVAPLLLTAWQLYLLSKTGSTLPKRWLSVRVLTSTGTVPGLSRILIREGIGSWGLPLSIAYILWRFSAFPHLGVLAVLSCLMVLGEGITARFNRQRRCWHDLIAGTHVVDANRTFTPLPIRVKAKVVQPVRQKSSTWSGHKPMGKSAAMAAPSTAKGWGIWWKWMRKNPTITLLMLSLSGLATVLGTLVGTQVYIQTQQNQRQLEQNKSEQFLSLVRQLDANPTSLDDRTRAILALGTIQDPQVLQLLVNLLGQETQPQFVNAVQQALVSTGPKALPYLHKLNQLLSNEIAAGRYIDKPAQLAVRTQQLQATQQAIAKILTIYSGKLAAIDLSRTNLGSSFTNAAFNLNLDQVNLAGIVLRGANLNSGSLAGSSWRGKGEDGHWDTSDDAIADLTDAQLKATNLTGANLSRVPMNRINLMRANLNSANLAHASLNDANLSSTQLVGANLQDAILTNASLTGANLGAANLSHANLYTARLSRVSALDTKLQSANLIKSDWQGADLSGADFSNTNLSDANLSATRLSSTNFRQGQMQNINLRNADLRLADLRGANLAGADLQGAILFSAKSSQGEQFIAAPSEYTESTLVKGVDFSKVKNLDPKQIAYVCTQGGIHPRCP
ncbi:MAG TPA: pentapeptide repeat-containing protein [Leptolyngbyaceae cyanobacterium]